MRKSDLLLAVFIILLLSGCRLRRPENVLPPKKMEQFLYDYHLAQAVTQDLSRDERYTTNAYMDWAYQKNGITKEEFDRSLIWYTRNPKEFAKIYKRLSLRVDDEYKSASRALSQIEKKSFTIESGDSVDLWYLNRTALLNTSNYMNMVTYRINRDTTFHKGDTVRLGFNSTFISIDSGVPQYAYVSLAAYYSDSIAITDTIIRENSPVALTVVLDTVKALSSISGSFNYMDSTDNRNSLLVVSGLELMRYHVKAVADTVSGQDSLPAPEL